MTQKKNYSVAVAGATGAVGSEMIKILQERNFPTGKIKLLASKRSIGKRLSFRGEDVAVEELTKDSFDGVDIALFSAGGSRSLEFAPAAASAGAVVIDNSSAFRMEDDVPLVVPEVNPHAVADYTNRGIIANPNCSTIQMVVALKPLHDEVKIKRVVVSTYQAVSGTGAQAIMELEKQTRAIVEGKTAVSSVYPHQIAFNCLPHIDVFTEDGYTKEELKMVNETRKILEAPDIAVTATTVRVPVYYGHSESVNVEFHGALSPERAREILAKAPGVVVMDEPGKNLYPLAINAAGKDDTYVGRIRKDFSIENGLNLWVVSDNLRKGAALNAVQIAELLIDGYI
ncbi:MAG: aspartate-semialdehyde dehydrogenase [Deltaproteobacteria bacterium]|nr:aspartate-semialdehyde dehydrogenase [Candidatus Zymogenaceae bacterium]